MGEGFWMAATISRPGLRAAVFVPGDSIVARDVAAVAGGRTSIVMTTRSSASGAGVSVLTDSLETLADSLESLAEGENAEQRFAQLAGLQEVARIGIWPARALGGIEGFDQQPAAGPQPRAEARPERALGVAEVHDDVQAGRRQVEALQVGHHGHQTGRAAFRGLHPNLGNVDPDHAQPAAHEQARAGPKPHRDIQGQAAGWERVHLLNQQCRRMIGAAGGRIAVTGVPTDGVSGTHMGIVPDSATLSLCLRPTLRAAPKVLRAPPA
jgi:hypothetical protein